jgi:hypothetical protein
MAARVAAFFSSPRNTDKSKNGTPKPEIVSRSKIVPSATLRHHASLRSSRSVHGPALARYDDTFSVLANTSALVPSYRNEGEPMHAGKKVVEEGAGNHSIVTARGIAVPDGVWTCPASVDSL